MAGFAAVLAVLTVAAVVGSASARFVVEKSAVKVIRPEHIKGRHDAALANFGVPNYGGTMVGVVKYQVNSTACNAFDGEPFKTGASRRPAILLVDRGDCYFALKAWNAQQAGAAAVLVADNIDEPLLTMDNPEESQNTDYVDKINIPAALINREFGAALKKALAKRDELVIIKLDWRESMPHPDERVEYEFWTNSNDECGPRCDDQMSFVKNFKGHAQLLERGGFAQFTPRYITWFCPDAYLLSKQCKAQCINKGRYCAPDPEQDFSEGYDGKDVVIENLRQLCVHRVGNETGRPWVWWDFVTDFHVRCSMKNKSYSRDCAEEVVKSLGKSIELIISSTILKEKHFLMRLTLMYQVCPGACYDWHWVHCLSDMETNECLRSNGGCWQDPKSNITACKDTFRGRLCVCPVVNNVKYEGDGYIACKAVGPGRCAMDNGGCWTETKDKQTYSACLDSELTGCRCPNGFYGDGYKCEDIDECKEKLACNCPECQCKNKWGGYDCKCKGDLVYIKGEDTCIAKSNNASKFGWILSIIVISCVAGAGLAGYIFYKYRLRTYMDSEIMAIMSQYMPLDSHNNEIQSLRQESTAL